MLDILQFDYVRGGVCSNKEIQLSEIKTDETYLFDNISQNWHSKISGSWEQLFSRNFLEEIQLLYIERVMYEDTDYLLNAYLLAKKIAAYIY